MLPPSLPLSPHFFRVVVFLGRPLASFSLISNRTERLYNEPGKPELPDNATRPFSLFGDAYMTIETRVLRPAHAGGVYAQPTGRCASVRSSEIPPSPLLHLSLSCSPGTKHRAARALALVRNVIILLSFPRRLCNAGKLERYFFQRVYYAIEFFKIRGLAPLNFGYAATRPL